MNDAFLEAYKAYLYLLIQRSEMGLVVTEFSEEFDSGEITETTRVHQQASWNANQLYSEFKDSKITTSNLIKNYYGLYGKL